MKTFSPGIFFVNIRRLYDKSQTSPKSVCGIKFPREFFTTLNFNMIHSEVLTKRIPTFFKWIFHAEMNGSKIDDQRSKVSFKARWIKRFFLINVVFKLYIKTGTKSHGERAVGDLASQ